ncbi:MAG: hypothetical protein ABF979_16280 [Gluconobacter sp.]
MSGSLFRESARHGSAYPLQPPTGHVYRLIVPPSTAPARMLRGQTGDHT